MWEPCFCLSVHPVERNSSAKNHHHSYVLCGVERHGDMLCYLPGLMDRQTDRWMSLCISMFLLLFTAI